MHSYIKGSVRTPLKWSWGRRDYLAFGGRGGSTGQSLVSGDPGASSPHLFPAGRPQAKLRKPLGSTSAVCRVGVRRREVLLSEPSAETRHPLRLRSALRGGLATAPFTKVQERGEPAGPPLSHWPNLSPQGSGTPYTPRAKREPRGTAVCAPQGTSAPRRTLRGKAAHDRRQARPVGRKHAIPPSSQWC